MSHGRYFESSTPSPEELDRARKLPLSACPRRYCWWWKTLSFDWDIAVADGCEWLARPKPSHWADTNLPCCRSEEWSEADHYEPREPHLEADGFSPNRFRSSIPRTSDDDATDA